MSDHTSAPQPIGFDTQTGEPIYAEGSGPEAGAVAAPQPIGFDTQTGEPIYAEGSGPEAAGPGVAGGAAPQPIGFDTQTGEPIYADGVPAAPATADETVARTADPAAPSIAPMPGASPTVTPDAPPAATPGAPPPSDDSAYLPPAEMFAGGGTSQFGVSLGYAVDIVFVIDITGSMTPVLEQVKAGALSFHDTLVETMAAKDKFVSSLRLRVVAYRDYYDNPSDALFHTPFFRLPDEQMHFNTYVSALAADGGGDEPESGLEALAVAFGSEWERGMDRRRHVVVLFTDASAHPLEASHGRYVPGYPTDMPNTFDALTDQWDDPQGSVMEYAAKRLLMYAPDVYPWNVISAYWDNVLHYPSAAGQGLNEVEFGQIVDAIAGSV